MRLFLILLMGWTSLFAQSEFEKIASVKLKGAKDFSVDQFKNFYVVKGVELIKYDPEAKKLYSFSEPILGDIYQVNVFNAMNPYVFYKDVNQLVVVDNRLNSSTALNFTDQNFLDVQFVSFADQNNVWFYDQATDKIYRINMQTKKVSNQSLNITQISGSENTPGGMVSTIDQVYLNVPDKGVFVFDAVGAFRSVIPLKNVSSFDVSKDALYAISGGSLIKYDFTTSKISTVNLLVEGAQVVKTLKDTIYLLTDKTLEVYRIK